MPALRVTVRGRTEAGVLKACDRRHVSAFAVTGVENGAGASANDRGLITVTPEISLGQGSLTLPSSMKVIRPSNCFISFLL